MINSFRDKCENHGVSPVIGVILVVAIVVILAAIIGAILFGFTGQLEDPSTSNAAFELNEQSGTIIPIQTENGTEYDVIVDGSKTKTIPGNSVGKAIQINNASSGSNVQIVNPETDQVIQEWEIDDESNIGNGGGNNGGGSTQTSAPDCSKISYNTNNGNKLVSNVSQLQCISQDTSSGYKITNNIDASGTKQWNNGSGFKPISSFSGTLDGSSYQINSLYINRSGSNKVALVKEVQIGGVIKNLGLDNVDIIGKDKSAAISGSINGLVYNVYSQGDINGQNQVGGVAGKIWSAGSLNDSYSNVNVEGSNKIGSLVGDSQGSVTDSYATGDVKGSSRVGGLIGLSRGSIKESYATGDVTASGNQVGGLTGSSGGGKVINVYASGDIQGAEEVGGLIGTSGTVKNGTYTGSYVNGSSQVGGLVGANKGGNIVDSSSQVDIQAKEDVGGLVGIHDSESKIINSYSTGDVSASKTNAGGLVGAGGNIIQSYSTGDVSVSGNYAGGITSFTTETINNSYSTGDVSGSNYVGGIAGLSRANVKNSYSAGDVSGSSDKGGLIGSTQFGGGAVDSYWDLDTSGVSVSSGGGTGLNTSEMQGSSASGNMNFDFTNVWETTSGYPELKWE